MSAPVARSRSSRARSLSQWLRAVLVAFLFLASRSLAGSSGATSLVMVSDPGDFVGGGVSYLFTPEHGEFTARKAWEHPGVTVLFEGSDNSWRLDFGAAIGGPLKEGIYTRALSFEDLTHPKLNISGNHRSPASPRSTFEVKRIIYGPDGSIIAFWATFEQHDNSGPPALRGEIRYHIDATEASTNQPPVANAGEDQRVPSGTTVNLVGRVADDDLPAANLTTTWGKVSGPGEVIFGTPDGLSTGATFSTPGDYQLRLTVSDGALSATDDVRVFVVAPGGSSPGSTTSLTMTSEPGDGLGLGENYSYTLADGDFDVNGNPNAVLVHFHGGGHDWSLDFAAPISGPLVPGVYLEARRYPFQPITSPGLSVGGDGRGADGLTGSFEIKKAIFASDGHVVAFWATFEQHAQGMIPALRGEIRFNADSTEPMPNRPPGVYAGEDRAVTIPGEIQLSGLAADDHLPALSSFVTTWSKVSGPGTVSFGDAAALVTTATFSTPGPYVLRLTATDGEFTRSDDVLMVVTDAESTSLSLQSEVGDPIGGGQSYQLNTSNAQFGASGVYGGASIRVTVPGQASWTLGFGAAFGPLKPGIYQVATDAGYFPWGATSLRVAGASYPSTIAGKFEIKKVVYGEGETLLSFWATFEQRANGSSAALRGEIKFNAASTAPGVNRAPVVNPGQAKRVVLPALLDLNAQIADDDLPAPANLSIAWSKASGPGPVVFGNINSPVTTASFSEAGTYVLQLSADDGEETTTRELTVTVVDPGEATSLRLQSDAGDSMGKGKTYQFTVSDGDFTARRNESGGVAVSFSTMNGGWSLTFAAPFGSPLQQGVYAGVMQYSGLKPDKAGLAVTNTGYTGTVTGSFEIKKVIYGPGNTIIAFWATFEQHLSGLNPALRGEVKFNAEATAPSTNQVPGVYAGPDRRVTSPSAIQLAGGAADDGLPGTGLVTQWTKVSGPGTVTFDHADAVNAVATFSIGGDYTLRLTASDGELTRTDEVRIVAADRNVWTSLDLHCEPGGSIGFGRDYHFTVADGDFTAAVGPDGSVSIKVAGPTIPFHNWTVTFAAPLGGGLTPGVYKNVVIYPQEDIQKPGLHVRNNDEWCYSLTGQFEVKKIVYGEDGTLVAFWATFTQHCEDEKPAVTGEIKYNAQATAPSANLAPGVWAGWNYRMAAPGSLKLTGYAADDKLPVGAPLDLLWGQFLGPAPATFATPAKLATDVKFDVPGDYILAFSATDGEWFSTDFSWVKVLDPEIYSALDLDSDPDDWIGQGGKYHYTELDADFWPRQDSYGQVRIGFDSFLWDLSFYAPPGSLIGPGRYVTSTHGAGISISGLGRAISYPRGWFEVKQIIYDVDGLIESFWATFEQISGPASSLRGEIKYRVQSRLIPVLSIAPLPETQPGTTTALIGQVDSYAGAGPLNYEWSVIEGPGAVTFADPHALETSATFSKIGVYRLRLTAADGHSINNTEVSVQVFLPPGRFAGIVRQVADPAGYLDLSMTPNRRITGSLRFGSKVVSLRGTFGADGLLSIPVSFGHADPG